MTNIIKDAKVVFASLTKKDGHKNNKHLLGVVVDKAFKKEFAKDFDTLWEENKTAKAKKPAYSMDDWFSTDEESGELVFWLNAKAGSARGIKFKQCDTCNFSMADFGVIGAGSIIDVSYDLYYFNSGDYGEMVLRSIKAVLLKKLVAYSDDGGVGGNDVGGELPAEKDELASDEVVEKKKKKKKKKNKD